MLFLKMDSIVAWLTHILQIIPVQGDARVLDVLRCQVALVMYDVTGNNETIGKAPLT